VKYPDAKLLRIFGIIIAGLMASATISAQAKPVTSVVQYATSEWNLQTTAPGQACNVSVLFGQSASLRIHASKGALRGLSLRLARANLESGKVYKTDISSADKTFTHSYMAKALSPKDIFILFEEDYPLDLMSHTQVMIITINNQSQALSILGLKEELPALMACNSDGHRGDIYVEAPKPQETPEKQAVSAINKVQAQAVEEVKLADSEPSQAISGAGIRIQPFPLDSEKNKTAVLKMEDKPTSQKSSSLDQSEPETLPTKNEVLTVNNKKYPQGRMVQSDAIVDQSAVITGQTQGAASLVRPPVMDLPLPPLEDSMVQNAEIAMDGIQSETSAPDGVIINHNAQLYATDDAQPRIMEKNDSAAEKSAFVRPAPRDEPGLLSQTHEMANVEPIIIPSVPEVALPTRFDLMNRGAPVQGGAKTASESPRQVRTVSNEDLEQQMKSALLGDSQSGGENPFPKQKRGEETETDIISEAKGIDPPHVAAAPPSLVKSAPLPRLEKVDQPRWRAAAESDLRTTIAEWSVNEGVELIWDTQDQFTVLQPLEMNVSYEQAVASLLNQYAATEPGNGRPKGELYIDPDSKRRILIIQTGI
jgi:hypothetical protein